jgi:hypothetical protein
MAAYNERLGLVIAPRCCCCCCTVCRQLQTLSDGRFSDKCESIIDEQRANDSTRFFVCGPSPPVTELRMLSTCGRNERADGDIKLTAAKPLIYSSGPGRQVAPRQETVISQRRDSAPVEKFLDHVTRCRLQFCRSIHRR